MIMLKRKILDREMKIKTVVLKLHVKIQEDKTEKELRATVVLLF